MNELYADHAVIHHEDGSLTGIRQWVEESFGMILLTLVLGAPGSILVSASIIYFYREDNTLVMLSLLLFWLTFYAVANSLVIAFVWSERFPPSVFWMVISELVVAAIIVVMALLILRPAKKERRKKV
jgi:hypothetical protein